MSESVSVECGDYSKLHCDLYVGGSLTQDADWKPFIDLYKSLDLKAGSIIRVHFSHINRADHYAVGQLVLLREYARNNKARVFLMSLPNELFLRLLLSHEIHNFDLAERKVERDVNRKLSLLEVLPSAYMTLSQR